MSTKTTKRGKPDRVRQVLLGLFLVSLGIYTYGAFTSSLFDQSLADKRAYLMTISQMPEEGAEEVQRRATLYWDTYPDVSRHEYFGRDGKLGIYGARTHYLKHGRYENRKWPE